MASTLSKTATLSTTAAAVTPPATNIGGRSRIQNLSATAGENIWLSLNPAVTAAVEADDCIRIGPGEQYTTSRLGSHSMIAAVGTPKVLIESV